MTARISVDPDVCELHGQCVLAAPELFWFDDDGNLQHREEAGADSLAAAQDAVFLCPTQAITVTPGA
ncbi:ferredoxin [Geodermatophilus sp. CPCC 206100]|uniref:ferredoxin n=1 Tax=Geodermatophilus sp. CPCC 206100 TaxID=3020054 RepID=UPI003B005345